MAMKTTRTVILLPLVLLGCGGGQSTSRTAGDATPPVAEKAEMGPPPPPPVPTTAVDADGWYRTPEQLARTVLEALQAKDRNKLWSLRVSEKLYKEELCPAFIASKPRHTLSVDFHWNLLKVNSITGLNEIMGDYGGRPMELVELEAPEKIEDYKTFKLWRRVRLKVRHNGEVKSIRVFGAIVERNSRFKLLAFTT
jgi:hypothetical protein